MAGCSWERFPVCQRTEKVLILTSTYGQLASWTHGFLSAVASCRSATETRSPHKARGPAYGVNMPTIVSAPANLIIGTSDGVPVRFAGLETGVAYSPAVGQPHGTGGLLVDLVGVRGPETQSRDARFLAERDDWARRRKEDGPEAAGPPPVMPGVTVLESVDVLVTDDVGTVYELASRQVAGDGTEWEARMIYSPAVPTPARIVTLQFTIAGEPTGTLCELRLD